MRRCRPGNRGRPTASSVTDEEAAYGLVLTAPAQRAIADRLPEAVAAAVTDFLYRIRDDRREVVVLGIEHRYDAYHPL